MAVTGKSIGFENDMSFQSSSSTSLAENKSDDSALPREDFLASIGLQPRHCSNEYRPKSAMPAGWRRVLVQRKVGRSAGKYDIYIFSPEGRKFRSKTELEAHIQKFNLNVSVSDFCFTVRGQHLMDIAASRDCNGQWQKRKRSSSQEMPVDGRIGAAGRTESVDRKPQRKRMKLWTPPSAGLVVNSDSSAAGASDKKQEKNDAKSRLSDGDVQLVKGSGVGKNQSLANKHVKGPHTKPRRRSLKLTVQMKFMPLPSKKLNTDNSSSQGHSSSPMKPSASLNTSSDAENADISNSVFDSESSRKHSVKCAFKQNNLQQKKRVAKQQTERSEVPMSRQSARNVNGGESSDDLRWIPPQSPFNLVEESLFHSSWKILVASIVLENGQGDIQRKALFEFFRRWPSVESALGATWQQVHRLLEPAGSSSDTAKTLLRFCEEYLTKNWCYPRELYGIKKYGDDAYRIFCINEWKQVAPDNPKLNVYHRWLWDNHRALGID